MELFFSSCQLDLYSRRLYNFFSQCVQKLFSIDIANVFVQNWLGVFFSMEWETFNQPRLVFFWLMTVDGIFLSQQK